MDRKVGVVTGAGGDIGLDVCRHLVASEAGVLCIDRDDDAVDRAVAACKDAGGSAEGFVADVSSEEAAFAYASRCRELWGAANFFFNNAGIEGAEKPLIAYPVDEWDRVMAVNLRGVFLGLKAMHPLLQHADTARVVNTASVAGMIATPQLAAYGASKHAVIGLTKTAAVEFAPHGIAVNALCPGPVESAMMRRIEAGISPDNAERVHRGYEATVPMGRYAKLDEVGMLATYLLLESPMYLTGQAVALDGGMVVS